MNEYAVVENTIRTDFCLVGSYFQSSLAAFPLATNEEKNPFVASGDGWAIATNGIFSLFLASGNVPRGTRLEISLGR